MARNFLRPERDAGSPGPLNTQGEEVVSRQRGLTRWPGRRFQRSQATTLMSRPVRVSSRVPTLPELPRFPSLPDYDEGNPGKRRSRTLPALVKGRSPLPDIHKPLPRTPDSPPTPRMRHPIRKSVPSASTSATKSTMCQSANCPIRESHDQGLYLHCDKPSKWRHPYWGISNPPHHIWKAWDRRIDRIATPQEVNDIFGFIQCHAYGKRGKAKEYATSRDYEAAR